MCRDKNNGGRRCPHDNNTARRNRRVNAKKKTDYEKGLVPSVEPFVSMVSDNTSKENVVIAISEYNEVIDRIGEPPVTPVFHTTKMTSDEIIAEQKLIEIGSMVESIAMEQEGMPTDEEFSEISNRILIEGDLIKGKVNKEDKKLSLYYYNPMIYINGEKMVYDTENGYRPIKEAILAEVDELDDDEADELLEAYNEWYENTTQLKEKYNIAKSQLDKMIKKRSECYRKALESVGVEFAGTDDLNIGEGYPDIQKASTFYPKTWIENSNNNRIKLNVNNNLDVNKRANYQPLKGLINYNKIVVDDSVITHELGHRMEWTTPRIVEAERLFLNRRAGFLDYHQGITTEEPNHVGIVNKGERGYATAGFAKDYMSKVYDFRGDNYTKELRQELLDNGGELKGGGAYEILTMGIESTFFGKHGGNVGLEGLTKDKEYGHFILGLLGSTAK